MFVLLTTGFRFEEENWIRFIKEKDLKKVILIRMVKKAGPHNWARDQEEVLKDLAKIKTYDEGEKEAVRKAIVTVCSLLDFLKRVYIDYEYHELLEDESELKKTAYISKIVTSQSTKGIIDIARGERLLVASFFKVAQYFPEKIVELGMSDFNKHEFIPILTTFMNPDLDQRKVSTYKDILSYFILPKVKSFTEIQGAVKHQSKDFEEVLPERNASHIKNRISNLTANEPGKPSCLEIVEKTGDKRKTWYELTDYGVFILYINYLRYKILTKEKIVDTWFTTSSKCFEQLKFNDFYERSKFNPI